MEHNILRGLVERGHSARAIINTKPEAHEYHGVKVMPRLLDTELESARWADVIITSFNYSRRSMNLAKDTGRRLFIINHNELVKDLMVDTFSNVRAIYNSNFVGSKLRYKVPSMVFHPPVFASDWTGTGKKEYITQLNVAEIKGGDKFVRIAGSMPEYKFYGTIGSYGVQQIYESRDNITVVPNLADVAEIYRRTKVLLMPSRYESFGQTQIEAGFFGIPTVYHPTPGLLESWGEHGIAIDREDHDGWVTEIKRLMTDRAYYKERSAAAIDGAKAHQAKTDWDALEKFLAL